MAEIKPTVRQAILDAIATAEIARTNIDGKTALSSGLEIRPLEKIHLQNALMDEFSTSKSEKAIKVSPLLQAALANDGFIKEDERQPLKILGWSPQTYSELNNQSAEARIHAAIDRLQQQKMSPKEVGQLLTALGKALPAESVEFLKSWFGAPQKTFRQKEAAFLVLYHFYKQASEQKQLSIPEQAVFENALRNPKVSPWLRGLAFSVLMDIKAAAANKNIYATDLSPEELSLKDFSKKHVPLLHPSVKIVNDFKRSLPTLLYVSVDWRCKPCVPVNGLLLAIRLSVSEEKLKTGSLDADSIQAAFNKDLEQSVCNRSSSYPIVSYWKKGERIRIADQGYEFGLMSQVLEDLSRP